MIHTGLGSCFKGLPILASIAVGSMFVLANEDINSFLNTVSYLSQFILCETSESWDVDKFFCCLLTVRYYEAKIDANYIDMHLTKSTSESMVNDLSSSQSQKGKSSKASAKKRKPNKPLEKKSIKKRKLHHSKSEESSENSKEDLEIHGSESSTDDSPPKETNTQ